MSSVLCLRNASAEDLSSKIAKAVEHSTLDQQGTKPFHLKAVLAPSFERDKSSNRSGTVEIWWASTRSWRWELVSQDFQQTEVVDGSHIWQKNKGTYLPEWLRETAVALTKPVPDLPATLRQAQQGEVRVLLGTTHISWVELGTNGSVSKGIGAGITIGPSGLTFAGGLGFDAGLGEPSNFHGRSVARKVTSGGGGPEVTAKVVILEDLSDVSRSLLVMNGNPSDPLIQTQVVDELSERKNLLPQAAPQWPPLQQGPLDGVLVAELVIDREGKVRDVHTVLSDNPGLVATARAYMEGMHFTPRLINQIPVQVLTTITMPFHTSRPAGSENLESARSYFERGRKAGFLAAGQGQPYILTAEFKARDKAGSIETGTYTDTWIRDDEWRREVDLGKSRLVRTRDKNTYYHLEEGSDAGLLRLVMTTMEPIPAIDTFVESDWRIKRDTVDGISVIRVASGPESADGTSVPNQFNGYYFDQTGELVKMYSNGLASRRTSFQSFNGVPVARQIDILKDEKLGMRIQVTSIGPAGVVDPSVFKLKGHEWVRQFTAEVR